MSYSYIGSTATSRHPFNQTTLTTPASLTVAGGDTIIIPFISGSADAGPFTISDSSSTSNIYTVIPGVNNLWLAYCLGAVAGTYTLTASGGTHIQNVAAMQYRGLGSFLGSTFTQQNGPGNGANLVNSGNATSTAQSAMVFGISVDGSNVVSDPPTFTSLAAGTSPLAFNDRGGFWKNLSTFSTSWFEDIRVTSTGNYAATFGSNANSSGDVFYTGVLIFGENVPTFLWT